MAVRKLSKQQPQKPLTSLGKDRWTIGYDGKTGAVWHGGECVAVNGMYSCGVCVTAIVDLTGGLQQSQTGSQLSSSQSQTQSQSGSSQSHSNNSQNASKSQVSSQSVSGDSQGKKDSQKDSQKDSSNSVQQQQQQNEGRKIGEQQQQMQHVASNTSIQPDKWTPIQQYSDQQPQQLDSSPDNTKQQQKIKDVKSISNTEQRNAVQTDAVIIGGSQIADQFGDNV
ncbi:MAG: hypothetical protein EZS28_047568, partial [Streblomastix strix]